MRKNVLCRFYLNSNKNLTSFKKASKPKPRNKQRDIFPDGYNDSNKSKIECIQLKIINLGKQRILFSGRKMKIR